MIRDVVVDKINIDFENCYGIRKLVVEFDFVTQGSVHAIYAPNGVMKTSFANAFRDLSNGKKSVDRVWADRKTKRVIVNESGDELAPESVFVVEPYKSDYRSTRISTLLVNEELRIRYTEIHREIDEKVNDLILKIRPFVGKRNGIKEMLSFSITHDENDFFKALSRVRAEVEKEPDSPLGDVIYSHIFNPKVEAVLNDPAVRERIAVYIEKYDELLSQSTFFRKGVFTHNNAADIAKNLNTNGFFEAEHSIYLHIGGEKREVSSLQELERAIQEEKDHILTNDELKIAFENIDKKLIKNAELKKFRQCIEENQILLTELDDLERLKQKLWVAYLIRAKDEYISLLEIYDKGKERIVQIVAEAKTETTRWSEVIKIFNERFSVPFEVRMSNQADVILKSDAPSVCFDFLEDPEDKNSTTKRIKESSLLDVLSNGEKRALYILNIIFEVEGRRIDRQDTLFVIDDIADSFDYKNKYAIIEYLKGIAINAEFRMLVLTHNFDFYRTIAGRLQINRKNLLTAIKDKNEILLEKEFYQNPFKYWRSHLHDSRPMLIASIPFLRNLAEFSGDKKTEDRLTLLLHFKSDTDDFLIKDLETLIKQVLNDQARLSLDNRDMSVKEVIYSVANDIIGTDSERPGLEGKIVLSIAIRLKAEEYMLGKINDREFWEGITKNQTIKLIERFTLDFPTERSNIQLIEQVNLMTPENIHLNAFMYEPIIDLSVTHLKKLYRDIRALQN